MSNFQDFFTRLLGLSPEVLVPTRPLAILHHDPGVGPGPIIARTATTLDSTGFSPGPAGSHSC